MADPDLEKFTRFRYVAPAIVFPIALASICFVYDVEQNKERAFRKNNAFQGAKEIIVTRDSSKIDSVASTVTLNLKDYSKLTPQ